MRRHRESFRDVPKPLRVLLFIGFAVIVVYALGQLIVFVWNHTIAEVTSWKPITFWQGLGLFLLTRLFFGGFKGNSSRWKRKGKKWKSRWNALSPEDRENIKERWSGMTSEDRAEVKAKWKNHCRTK